MKETLREKMREKRQSLSPALYIKKSSQIRLQLEELPQFQRAKRILIYISTGEEVDTQALIHDALEKRRRVFVPKVQGDKLAICPLYEWGDLQPGTFGILEPCEILNEAHPESMDLIVIPGIAFDKKGNRLGFGKGFYDKLLKRTQGYKVGLAFTEQIVDRLPLESHDVPLDLIITDENLIYP